jgi:hypothetical protein
MSAVVLTHLLVALYLSALVEAQSQSVRPPKPAAPVKPPAGTTFTGCLTKSSGSPTTYDLTVTNMSASGTATESKVYRLMPVAGVDLAEHAGHRVTITGSQAASADVKQTAGKQTAGGPAKQLQLRATDIHHVAPTCK